mgnify:CR=1 FL=1
MELLSGGKNKKYYERGVFEMKKRKVVKVLISFMLIFVLTLQPCIPAKTVSAASETETKIRDTVIGGERSQLFNSGWKFTTKPNRVNDEQGDVGKMYDSEGNPNSKIIFPSENPEEAEIGYNDSTWNDIELPHDWMISNFDNGNKEKSLYVSKFLWYRNTFYMPEEQKGKNIAIRFDGVYMDTTVYVNGEKVGEWPNGYTSFQFDITEHLNYGNEPNVIAVLVNVNCPNARWYAGAGIYRNVWLTVTDPVHVDFSGTYISTYPNNVSNVSYEGKDSPVKPDGFPSGKNVVIDTDVTNTSKETASNVTVTQEVIDPDNNNVVATNTSSAVSITAGQVKKVTQYLNVNNPKLWDIEDPTVYTMKTTIKKGQSVVDEYLTTFGFRTVKVTSDEGFFLNGKYVKLNGVCLHHDLGSLGTAVNYRALERQMESMKEMGVNALRTSHNQPAPELLEICDRLGIMVIVESYDYWGTDDPDSTGKSTYDYGRFFYETREENTKAWIKRDRNHPSTIMWSVANEIYELGNNNGAQAKELCDFVREEDPRKNALTTFGSNIPSYESVQKVGANIVDVFGHNYQYQYMDEIHEKWPDSIIYCSESSSAVRSRGVYLTPSDVYGSGDAELSQLSSINDYKYLYDIPSL